MKKKKPTPGATRPWEEVRKAMFTPEQNARIDAEAAFELTLMELRKSRHMTQVQLAKLLEITQGTLSRLESQEAVPMLDTLNNYIRAMGGELVIGARFPDAQYLIDIGEKARGIAKSKRSHAKIKAA